MVRVNQTTQQLTASSAAEISQTIVAPACDLLQVQGLSTAVSDRRLRIGARNRVGSAYHPVNSLADPCWKSPDVLETSS